MSCNDVNRTNITHFITGDYLQTPKDLSKIVKLSSPADKSVTLKTSAIFEMNVNEIRWRGDYPMQQYVGETKN